MTIPAASPTAPDPGTPEVGQVASETDGAHVRVWALTLGMTAVAAAVHFGLVPRVPGPVGEFPLPWWALAVLFTATEVFVIHVHVRRETHSISLSEIPLVLGLAFSASGDIVLGRLVGSALALIVHRRQGPTKLGFNLSLFYLESCVALVLFRSLVAGSVIAHPRGWLAALAAIVAVDVLGAFVVTTAISLHERRLKRELLPSAVAAAVVNATTNTSLALVAAIVAAEDPRAVALLMVMAGILFGLYRSYSSLRQRYSSLEALYAFTRNVGRSLQVEDVIATMLSEARDLLRAERAEITLLTPGEGPDVRRWALDGDGPVVSRSLERSASDISDPVSSNGAALLVARNSAALAGQLAALGIRDAMVAPLVADGGVVGTMLVANSLGEVRAFDQEDLKLFETLANHASITLENGRLVDRLRREATEKEHQALHDALTGLPNRAMFRSRVEHAISRAWGTDHSVAVMLMDLDRFKEVNDTLGHHNGDLLLQEVSARLSGLLRNCDVVARLGGDEFAILLPRVGDPSEAVAAAEKVLGALAEPFVHRELTLEVGASIGIAVYPEHGGEASTLLQRADVAMYAAKAAQCGFEIYAADKDQYSPRRLALVGELRSAIEHEQLEVHYQPAADLRGGQVVGVEALVRWNHPRHGYLPPDEFVPVAEHTGLIRPLTMMVLRTALRQCQAWRETGIALRVAVNLSARSLLDVALPDEIGALLAESQLPRGTLTLEITESSIMADSPRTVGVMSRLHGMGIELAIDDFGTGYSSLSYLKRLPVDEIKIDRSFVFNMASSESDAKIVRSTVNLGRDLGLRVVAEGVETRETWDRLAALGCDLAQGYFLSRPVPAAELERWLRSTWAEGPAATVVRLAR